ncbi:MAG: ABC transporter substrate-binding protein, partial [Clostridia bacterium]|nr:ABC transporter substrate-binding protein [Clostridia bacterium]
MKKLVALLAALLLVVSCAGVAMAEDEITLDVIICQYGNNTENWFLGTGMNGTSFVKKFEAENPGIKLNLEVVSWDDVRSEVSTRITNN